MPVTTGGKQIMVRSASTPSGCTVAVEDDGLGMTDEEKALAFERFYRGTNAALRYSRGVGLGLPVARAIAKAHGGGITLADRPGGGLIAVLALPSRFQIEAVR